MSEGAVETLLLLSAWMEEKSGWGHIGGRCARPRERGGKSCGWWASLS
jgi:hypothetical protein